MCLPALAVAAVAAGTILKVGGALEEGKATSNALMYRSQVAQNNAMIADQNASYAVERGERMGEVRTMQTSQQIGSARAAMGASGVRIDSGSPARVQGDISAVGAMDVETIRNNALREAYGYRVQAMGFRADSSLDTMGAEQARKAARIKALSSLAGGAQSTFGSTGFGTTPMEG